MDKERVDQVIQFVLLAAGQEDERFDRELGPIHIIKYVYVADLAYARRREGKTFTGVPWRFFHFGPWTEDVVERIEPALRAVGAQESTFSSKYADDSRRWSKVDDELFEQLRASLPPEITSTVCKYVHEFGKDTAELLHFVYTTAPMVRAAPNEPLSFYPNRTTPQTTNFTSSRATAISR